MGSPLIRDILCDMFLKYSFLKIGLLFFPLLLSFENSLDILEMFSVSYEIYYHFLLSVTHLFCPLMVSFGKHSF